MYNIVLLLHSWNRWLLFLAAIFLVVKSLTAFIQGKSYTRLDGQLAQVLFWSLNIQLILGVVLMFVSPLIQGAFSDMGAAMSNGSLRFYVAEHTVAAILAIGAGHFGIARSKKATDDRSKHRFMMIGAGLCVVILLYVIPWPNLPYGRALFFGM